MCDKRKYQRPTGGKAWEFHTSRRPLPFHDSASIYEAPSHCNTCHYYHIAICVANITITLHLPSPSWTLYVELRKFITSTVAFGLFINCITCSNTFGNIHGISIVSNIENENDSSFLWLRSRCNMYQCIILVQDIRQVWFSVKSYKLPRGITKCYAQ